MFAIKFVSLSVFSMIVSRRCLHLVGITSFFFFFWYFNSHSHGVSFPTTFHFGVGFEICMIPHTCFHFKKTCDSIYCSTLFGILLAAFLRQALELQEMPNKIMAQNKSFEDHASKHLFHHFPRCSEAIDTNQLLRCLNQKICKYI